MVILAGISLLNSAADDAGLACQSINLSFAEIKSASPQASDIFVVYGTNGNDKGLDKLINLMNEYGLPFYQPGNECAGLIASNEVVLLKVNSQWDMRGGTNTDLVKALVKAIVNHPAGFTGEVIIADNGQSRGNLSYARNNAQDIAQSMQKVAEYFPEHNVSTYLWDEITSKWVGEYSQGDIEMVTF